MKEKIQALKAIVKERASASRGVTQERIQAKQSADRQSEDYRLRQDSIAAKRRHAREESRTAHLAYGFLRGVPYLSIEPNSESSPYTVWIAELASAEKDAVQAWLYGETKEVAA